MAAPAFKEWAVIVRALLEGEQILDLRKGGIREDGRHFDLRATRFWLYPTTEHQEPALLKTAYRDTIALSDGSPVGDTIRIPGWAEVVGTATLTDAEHLDIVASKTIWTTDYAASRLNWKKKDPLWVLALRVHRLTEMLTVPWREEYGGCTSWVDLEGLPDEPTDVASEPALSDIAFEARYKGVVESLPDGLTQPREGGG